MYRTEETVQVAGNPFITIVAHGSPISSCLRPVCHLIYLLTKNIISVNIQLYYNIN